MIKITVITVCFNEKNRIKKTIESVCCQSYPYIEYLIIDGNSDDGTIKILQKYSKYNNIHIFSEKDHGLYNAMNRGIARATGDYIYFLNAGDVFYNEFVIEHIVNYMKENKDIIYIGKVCSIFSDDSKTILDFFMLEETLEEALLNGGMPCHQSIFSPKKLLVNHYFREEFKIRADFEWLIYSISRKNKYKNIPIIISNYDATGISSRLKNCYLYQQEEEIILNEYQKYFLQENDLKNQDKRITKWKNLSGKHLRMFQLMNHWMILKQKKFDIVSYLQQKNYHNIAIYGMNYFGQRLYDELKESCIKIKYIIDKNAANICSDLHIILPNEKIEDVDVIIITAIIYFDEIKKELLEKGNYSIVSLEDMLYEMAI